MVVEIIIVQHGEKKQDGNDPGLTALGRRQANVTARFIADKFNIGAIVSSPLKRARETAEVISDELGISVNIDGRFRERMNWDPAITGQSLEEFLVDWDRASRDREYVPYWVTHRGKLVIASGKRSLNIRCCCRVTRL